MDVVFRLFERQLDPGFTALRASHGSSHGHRRWCWCRQLTRSWPPHRAREQTVPFVNVKVIEGVFTSTQKQEMIAAITNTMVAIEGENLRGVTWVVVEEVRSGDWGIGGQGLRTSDVQAMQGEPALATTAG